MDKFTITLRRACACAIPAALEALAARARQNNGPFRAYCPFLVVLRIEDYMVPFGIQAHRHGKLQSWGIYRKLPAPGDPLGLYVLSVTAALCPNCQAAATASRHRTPDHGALGCSQAPCDGCNGKCCEELQVHFTYGRDFPFLLHEVRWFFFNWFGMHEEAWAALPQDYRDMDDIYQKYDAAPAATEQSAGDDRAPKGDVVDAAGSPQPARGRSAGAPLLIANQFLLNEMRANPNLPGYNYLRPRWLELYVEQIGRPPDNVGKSFREAVRKCRARLKRTCAGPQGG